MLLVKHNNGEFDKFLTTEWNFLFTRVKYEKCGAYCALILTCASNLCERLPVSICLMAQVIIAVTL